MNIGIFSKFEMAGGSEFRGVALSNGLIKYSDNNVYLLCEGERFPEELANKLDPKVNLIKGATKDPSIFYKLDHLIIINTDSKHFTKLNYWEGKTEKHATFFDLTKIKTMTYIFNFIISPCRHLVEIEKKCPNIKIITTNKRFYDEFTTKEKIFKARHFPRIILESPIEPETVSTDKTLSNKIRIGKHSKGLGSKWNKEHKELIEKVNEKYGDKIVWDFMGVNREVKEAISGISNVICREEFSKSVKDYLADIDIFLFFIDYTRHEPWARAVGEAIMSGCPIVATDVDGGNRMQVVRGSNGFLCKDLAEFKEALEILIENADMRERMRKNSLIYSKFFTSEEIIRKLLRFL